MNTITKFILNQVASNQLSREEAKSMLLELQNLEAAAAEAPGFIEPGEATSSRPGEATSSRPGMANSSEMAKANLVGQTPSEVAIIGMAGKFPKALDLEEYWAHLTQGRNCIDHYPESRLKDYLDQCAQSPYASLLMDFTPAEADPEAKADNLYVKGGFLPEVDKFDAAFFRISPREAMFMDPLQRIFLETAFEAMEDAGYGGKKLYGAKVGVFAGKDHTAPTMYRYFTEPDPLHWTGSWTGILASRIAYLYNWRGPCMVIDTACSSGLVAIHEACRALQHHDCEMAIAGGIHLQLFPVKKGSALVMEGVESANGLVRTFDKEATGTVWGEGAGVIVLKLLHKAVADGDPIQAVIKGSAINNDGASNGITAPNMEAQKEVILRAWKEAKIDPETISYIEAHGTGTNLGDPIEIKGLVSAFREYTAKKQFCGIGSVKTNVGHLVAASGLASVIKVALALKNHQIPPSINFSTPNPYINFCDSPVYVNDRLRPWEPKRDTPRRAGISSFGFSGTNCHLVLEEAPSIAEVASNPPGLPGILTLSAHSKNGLAVLLEKYHDYLGQATGLKLADICYTANTGRGHYGFRLALIVTDLEDLTQKITKLKSGDFDTIRESSIFLSANLMAPVTRVDGAIGSDGVGTELSETERRRLSAVAAQELQKFINAGNREADFSEFTAALCQLYIQGAEVDWDKFYQGQNVKRLSLPAYPLERIKCWAGANQVLIEGRSLPQKPIHPLIHRLLLETFEQKVFLTVFNVKTHWVLSEHQVLNYYVIPGTTYLEMARVASGGYFENGPFELRDFLFVNPLVVNPGEAKEVQTIIKKQTGYLDFVVVSKAVADSEEGAWVIHAQGKVYQVKFGEPGPYNLAELKQRLDADHNQKEINLSVELDNVKGFTFGPRWENIIRTVVGRDEALIQIKLPEEFEADLQDYYLHPALMDHAVNAFSQEIGAGMYLPFIYEKMIVYDRMPGSFYSHLRRKGPSTGNLETITLDISLFDESGRVFAEVFDYSVKKAHEAVLHFKKLSGAENTYYGFEWLPVESGEYDPSTATGSILVFKDQTGIADQLIRKLQDKGRHLIEVEVGLGYQQINQNKYLIQGVEADYHKLLQTLNGQKLSQILHLMAITDSAQATPRNLTELEARQTLGLDSLFYLVRALAENLYLETVDLVLIADNVHEVTKTEERINPHHAAFFGLGKVVSLENPRVKCRAIDIDRETTADRIVTEVLAKDSVYQVAYRHNQRFIEEFRRLTLETKLGQVISENGVYVISGGTGGIGLEIGKFLAAKARVKLALINRSSIPGREAWNQILQQNKDRKLCAKITAIREMEQAGSEVGLFSADVAREADLKPVLDEVRQKYGKINGVIHAAGVAGAGFMIKKDFKTFKNAVAPKIQGTWLLDKLTETDDLDFFILFSSITTITGGPGQSDYTAANSYLDAFAVERNRRGQKAIVIDWPLWNGVGMAADYQVTDDDLIFKGLSTPNALAIFAEILDSGLPSGNSPSGRIIPGELNYQVIDGFARERKRNLPFELSAQLKETLQKLGAPQAAGFRESNAPGPRKSGPETARTHSEVEYVAPRDEIERNLAVLWQEVLGIEIVGIHANFFELGGHSLKAFQLIEKANQRNLHLSITDIFTANTIAGMAALIRQETQVENASITPEGETPLIPVQSCFFEHQFPEPHHWNLSVMSYSREGFDVAILRRVLTKIAEHHDALRMAFQKTSAGIIQWIRGLDQKLFDLEVLDLTQGEDSHASARVEQQIELETARIQGSIDLEQGPLMKAGLFKTDQGDHLLLTVHHLVLDGESLGILLEDLRTGYIQAMSGAVIQLPKKTSSFQEWARQLQDYGGSDQVLGELDYWRKIDETSTPPLPKDHLVTDHRFRFSKIIKVTFPVEDSAGLFQPKPEGLSIQETLLISFGIALREWTGAEKALVRVIGNGRDLGLAGMNLSRTIGWLSISYPVILEPGYSTDLWEQVRKMRDEIRSVPGNGAGYDILRYITLPLKKTLPPLTAMPEIIFNFLGMLDDTGVEGDDPLSDRIEVSKIPLGFTKSPESPKEYTLDVNVYISGGRLEVSLDYNRLEYEEVTIRHLGELFLGKVKGILELGVNRQ